MKKPVNRKTMSPGSKNEAPIPTPTLPFPLTESSDTECWPSVTAPVIAMINISATAGVVVVVLADHGGITVVPVAVLDADAEPLNLAQVRTAETIGWIRGMVRLYEPVGVLQGPFRVDTGVIGDDVAGQANAVLTAASHRM